MFQARTLTAGLALVASLGFAGSSLADNAALDFKLENRTGYTLKELYISPSAKDNWGKNILKGPLKDKANLNIKWKETAKAQTYDLKAVYADNGKSPVWKDLDPTTFSRLELKWDKAKDKTVAVKHR
jgi:hypothetical protein